MILHSQILGKGDPLLILHGFLGMGDNWRTLGRRYAEDGFEVHLIDQRNHGRSFHRPEFSYQLMSGDLLAYCNEKSLDKVRIIGHSMGGKTAMQFATSHPDLVSHLLVADIAPKHYPLHHQDILKALHALNFDEINSRGEADEVLSKYISEAGIRQFLLKNLYWVEKGRLGLRINLPVLTEKIEEVGKALPEGAIFEGPVLFLGGERSGYIQPMDELLISRHFPKAQIDHIPGAGHWLHAENPDAFYQRSLEFFTV